jgi:hypothetical protein
MMRHDQQQWVRVHLVSGPIFKTPAAHWFTPTIVADRLVTTHSEPHKRTSIEDFSKWSGTQASEDFSLHLGACRSQSAHHAPFPFGSAVAQLAGLLLKAINQF